MRLHGWLAGSGRKALNGRRSPAPNSASPSSPTARLGAAVALICGTGAGDLRGLPLAARMSGTSPWPIVRPGKDRESWMPNFYLSGVV